MTTTTNYTWDLPTVGGDEDTWGAKLNGNWTALDTLLGGVNATEFAILGGATVTTDELNALDGVTWTLTDYNTLTATAAELNLLDGLTAVSGADTTIVTGTAGSDGDIVQWNADGDLVSYGAATQSQATWEAGTDTTESLVSPAKVKAAVEALAPASFPAPDYESAELSVASGAGGALAHGLGVIPSLIKVVAVCKNSIYGYTAGMEVDITNTQPTWTTGTAYSVGVVVAADATNITYRQGATRPFGLLSLSTGGNILLAATEYNWKLVIRAWA